MAGSKVDLVRIGPGQPAGQWLRCFWQPVYVGDKLPAGWAKRIRILGEYFTLYRGEGGSPHLVEERCPHRKTQLSTGSIEGDDLRCFYHGWKFAGDGRCLEQPAEHNRGTERVRIRSYPVREYLGMIFAYLGKGEAPEFPLFPELENDNGYPIRARRTELKHNYLVRVENDMDEAHVHFVHRRSAGMTREFSALPVAFNAEETDYGILRLTTRDRGGKKDVRRKYFLMPNVSLTSPPPATELDNWAPHIGWRVPIDDETTYSFTVSRNKPRENFDDKAYQPADDIIAAILDSRMRLKDVDPYHPRLFHIQDSIATAGQGRLYDDRDSEQLGRSDVGVALLRRIYEREIAALMDGRPIKTWRRPKEKLIVGFFPAAAE